MNRENEELINELIKKLLNDEIKIHELERITKDANIATLIRRKFLELKFNISLSNVSLTKINWNEVVGRNIENPVGVVHVPVGIVGPLKVIGEYANGEYYIPLATTEGALVASVNRGCKAITLCGGARVRIISDGMTRAPLFRVNSIDEALKLIKWVNEHFDEIKKVAESTTRHGKLKKIEYFIVGNNVWLRFIFDTADAMGMNMVTIATDRAVKYIQEQYPKAKLVSLSGNLCVDKKPNAINFILGRGKTVISEVVVPRNYLIEKFNITPEQVVDVNNRKNLLGSAYAHSYGFNAHFANIIAAIFIATGQDVAQVVESSMGITWAEVLENGDLYFSITLPSLEVGTVGGGTRLPTQSEALRILGVQGSGNPPDFKMCAMSSADGDLLISRGEKGCIL